MANIFRYGNLLLATYSSVEEGETKFFTFTNAKHLNRNRSSSRFKSFKASEIFERIGVGRHEVVICLNTRDDDQYFIYLLRGRVLGHLKPIQDGNYTLISEYKA